jgi:hypothetical protein
MATRTDLLKRLSNLEKMTLKRKTFQFFVAKDRAERHELSKKYKTTGAFDTTVTVVFCCE